MLAKSRIKLSWLVASLGTWACLAASVFGLTRDLEKQAGFWSVILIGPSLAILCGHRAVRLSSQFGAFARVGLWIPTTVGAALVALLFQGSCERLLRSPMGFGLAERPWPESPILLFSALALPILVSLGLAAWDWRFRRSLPNQPKRDKRWIWDFAAAASLVALLSAGGIWWLNVRASRLLDEGAKRWAEIGRPIPEFVNTIKPTEENASLQALLADLRPYGVVTLYRADETKPGIPLQNKLTLPIQEAVAVLGAAPQPEDRVVIPQETAPKLAAMADELDRLYAKILSRPPPIWKFSPDGGFQDNRPDYLVLRQLSQLTKADALLRLARGDTNGATQAIAAGLRISKGLDAHPWIVTSMIRIAIEALYASATARLPEDANAWEQLARESDSVRAGFKYAVQYEAVSALQMIERQSTRPDGTGCGPLPRWAGRFIDLPGFRLDCARAWMIDAGVFELWNSERLLTSPDLGAKKLNELLDRYPSSIVCSLTRAWARLNFALLLREQAEIVRFARARMVSGQLESSTERPSIVIPGAKWEILPDLASHSVALKLTPTPPWVQHDPDKVTSPDFFLLPLDGSKSWNCNTPVASSPGPVP